MKYLPLPTTAESTRVAALEGHYALRVTACLSEAASHLPHDIVERLRFGREQALQRARAVRAGSVPASSAFVQANGSAALGGPPSLWLRLASLMPLVALVVGLMLIQQYHDGEQVLTAAEIDTALLADEVPPTAYGDPGFAEFLRGTDTR